MTTINDGGPAFPVLPPLDVDGNSPAGYPYPAGGMSLRDWFAGQALASPDLGRIAFNFREADLDRHFGKGSIGITDAMKLAAAARDVADAMLAAREGK